MKNKITKYNANPQPYKKNAQCTQVSLSPAYENVAHTCREIAERCAGKGVVMSSHRALPSSLVFWAAGGRLDLGRVVTLSRVPCCQI